MPIGPDRVQVYKRESSSMGGDDADDFEEYGPIPIAENEDAVSTAGGYVQDSAAGSPDELVGWYRTGTDLIYFDGANPAGVTLSAMLAGGTDPADFITADGQAVTSDGDFVTL